MFRRALSALGLNAGQNLLSEAEFTHRFLAGIETAYPDAAIDVTSDLTVTLNRGRDNEHPVDLVRLYGMYQMDPDRLDVLIHLHTASVTEALTLAAVELSADLLVPLVRAARELRDLDDDTIIAEPLTNDLTVLYAFDMPHTLKYLTTTALAKLGIAREDLKALSVANAAKKMDRAVIDLHAGVVLVSSEQISPTSLLFVPEFWQQGVFASMPNIAVIVPDRDIVIAFDADSQQAILGAASVASEIISQSSAPMSKEVMLIKADPNAAEMAPPPVRPSHGGQRDGRRASFGG
jgi:uncharacterized protein YtpQ (UPF0354 family)